MADFEKALAKTLPHEGWYSNVEGDNGGETYAGISRKNFPKWKGWEIVDAHKPLKWNQKIEDQQLDKMIAAFYRVEKWNKVYGENIRDQGVASFLFDWHVNSGYHAVEALQKIIGAQVDGVMGSRTVTATNNYIGGDLLQKLIAARKAFVKAIVNRKPTQEKFLAGWNARIDSYA